MVRVRAQVMMRDDNSGGWVPMGGGGLSHVSVRKRKVNHEENDQPCKHEYLIHGKRISDQTVRILRTTWACSCCWLMSMRREICLHCDVYHGTHENYGVQVRFILC